MKLLNVEVVTTDSPKSPWLMFIMGVRPGTVVTGLNVLLIIER
jgi:hypothetical protein